MKIKNITAPIIKEKQWYALIINPLKSKLAVESIRLLRHKDVEMLLSVSEMHTGLKMKSKMLFIKLFLSDDLKRRILNIQNVYNFFPNSADPCVIKDIENFIPGLVLPKGEIEIVTKKSSTEVSKMSNTAKVINFKVGDLINVLRGPLKGVSAIIIDLNEESSSFTVEISFCNTVAVAEVSKYDAELVK